jgi:hypothetical protein
VVALVLLAVLTLLGVTAMNTTSMEERMAANTQEGARALQLAETGLALAYADQDAYDIGGLDWTNGQVKRGEVGVGQFRYRANFVASLTPPPGSGWSASQFRVSYYHFESEAEPVAGGAPTGVAAELAGGFRQLTPAGAAETP